MRRHGWTGGYRHRTILVLVLLLCACRPATRTDVVASGALAPVTLQPGHKLAVVATTSVVADIVSRVAGDLVDLRALLAAGNDPHAFEPTPREVAAVIDAHVVFANGAGLEQFMARLLSNAAGETPVVYVSDGIALRRLSSDHIALAGPGAETEAGDDPHTWTSPANAVIFVRNIAAALQTLDPANAEAYADNARAYTAELQQVDAWIAQQVAAIPPERRKLVTEHLIFGYYADRYGFQQVGALVPTFSSGAAPSARELAALEDTIRALDVRAVFVGVATNRALADRISSDTGIALAGLYTEWLSPPGGPASTYLDYLRFNTRAIVSALR